MILLVLLLAFAAVSRSERPTSGTPSATYPTTFGRSAPKACPPTPASGLASWDGAPLGASGKTSTLAAAPPSQTGENTGGMLTRLVDRPTVERPHLAHSAHHETAGADPRPLPIRTDLSGIRGSRLPRMRRCPGPTGYPLAIPLAGHAQEANHWTSAIQHSNRPAADSWSSRTSDSRSEPPGSSDPQRDDAGGQAAGQGRRKVAHPFAHRALLPGVSTSLANDPDNPSESRAREENRTPDRPISTTTSSRLQQEGGVATATRDGEPRVGTRSPFTAGDRRSAVVIPLPPGRGVVVRSSVARVLVGGRGG